jgi:hypothetical protein
LQKNQTDSGCGGRGESCLDVDRLHFGSPLKCCRDLGGWAAA